MFDKSKLAAILEDEGLIKTASWEVEEWFDLRRPIPSEVGQDYGIEGYSYGRILAQEDSIYLELWENDDMLGGPVFEEVKGNAFPGWFTDDPEEEAQSAVDDMIAELKRGNIPRDFRYIDV